MKIIIGKKAGFCFGVENAVTQAKKELEKSGKTYCLGELVHNKQVTEELIKKGMEFIEDVSEAKGRMIIRSHGASKSVYEEAKNKGLDIIDLTCPKVLHIHNIVEEYSNNGYYIIIVGQEEHPEMIGTISFCKTDLKVINDENQVEEALSKFYNSNRKKLLLIAQTTFSLEKFNKISEKLKKELGVENFEIKNTICGATRERQEETQQLAQNVDKMIIIGGKHSSNSTKLYELANKYCSFVRFVETEKEIKKEDFNEEDTVGIMAGASTPEKSIQKVVEKLQEMW